MHMTRFKRALPFAASAGLSLGLVMLVDAQGTPGSQSPSEKIAKRIAELLQPGNKAAAAPVGGPVNWRAAKAVEQPPLPPAVFKGTPPPPSSQPGKPVVPRAVPEASPPSGDGKLPTVAKPMQLPTQPLPALPAIDVESPLPLPILATPKPDRATLDDITLETSQAAALRPVRPRRTQPVPFAPLNLPDPFEHIRGGGLRNPQEESDQPPAIPVRTPGR
jgi:hypothetical protein